jgi:hypothetical protein
LNQLDLENLGIRENHSILRVLENQENHLNRPDLENLVNR